MHGRARAHRSAGDRVRVIVCWREWLCCCAGPRGRGRKQTGQRRSTSSVRVHEDEGAAAASTHYQSSQSRQKGKGGRRQHTAPAPARPIDDEVVEVQQAQGSGPAVGGAGGPANLGAYSRLYPHVAPRPYFQHGPRCSRTFPAFSVTNVVLAIVLGCVSYRIAWFARFTRCFSVVRT